MYIAQYFLTANLFSFELPRTIQTNYKPSNVISRTAKYFIEVCSWNTETTRDVTSNVTCLNTEHYYYIVWIKFWGSVGAERRPNVLFPLETSSCCWSSVLATIVKKRLMKKQFGFKWTKHNYVHFHCLECKKILILNTLTLILIMSTKWWGSCQC
jgi:hypothetical protein